jgi:hypothetical protein
MDEADLLHGMGAAERKKETGAALAFAAGKALKALATAKKLLALPVIGNL